jgi:tetratricopeptide (TPR) repeat protein
MLKIAESFFPFSEQPLSKMPSDQRYGTAFTRYYLALIEKNYGDIRQAQNYIEDSYVAWGKGIDNELLTPTARAEILSYAPGGIDKAREAIAEILERIKNLKRGGRPLAKHDAICAVRVSLMLGNTYYLESEWQQALAHYQDALKADEGHYYPYYTYHSLAQAQRKLGQEAEANQSLDLAYKYLLESRHLETKVALDSRILLNALAYLCTRTRKSEEAVKYKQAILQHWLTIQKVDDLELRLFSLEQKRQVSKEEFWNELFSETSSDATPRT